MEYEAFVKTMANDHPILHSFLARRSLAHGKLQDALRHLETRPDVHKRFSNERIIRLALEVIESSPHVGTLQTKVVKKPSGGNDFRQYVETCDEKEARETYGDIFQGHVKRMEKETFGNPQVYEFLERSRELNRPLGTEPDETSASILKTAEKVIEQEAAVMTVQEHPHLRQELDEIEDR